MPWLIGIDEAGYGPNLGPLVMTSVACRLSPLSRSKSNGHECQVAENVEEIDVWKRLRLAVRTAEEEDDGRIVIGDSKLVYTTARGLGDLEKSVLACVAGPIATSSQLLQRFTPVNDELRSEPWYTGETVLPIEIEVAEVAKAGERFLQASARASLSWGLVRSVLVCARRFNEMVDKWDSKGAVLALGLSELIRANMLECCHTASPRTEAEGGDNVTFVVDKHGGRNHYAAVLQHAFEEAMVVAREEGMHRSAYYVLGLDRDVHIYFEPRADARHFCVALASMISKYVREVLMSEFNRFWQKHVPDLKPTAGYPGDSSRYMEAIAPALRRLGIPEYYVWRRR